MKSFVSLGDTSVKESSLITLENITFFVIIFGRLGLTPDIISWISSLMVGPEIFKKKNKLPLQQSLSSTSNFCQ